MSCPICGEKSDPALRPFCSKRCADIDLGKWFSGQYAVPSRDPEDIEKAAEALEKDNDGEAKPH